jgi:hypothetical protein
MLKTWIAYGTLAFSLLALGCDSPTEAKSDLLIGRWLAYEREYDGVVRHLSLPSTVGIGQFDFSPDGTVEIRFWFDGHLAFLSWPHEWKTEGSELFTRADQGGDWESQGTYSVNKKTLVLTLIHTTENTSTSEIWRYSRVTP